MVNNPHIHFISGLPRSGSTLLAAILKQNPNFVAGMTSPVATIYRHTEDAMSRRQETAVFVDNEIRTRMLKGVFAAYYGDAWGVKTIFDTNRMWCARTGALASLFPESKIICCVRDVGQIMESFERIYQGSPFEPSGVYGYDTSGTVFNRVRSLAGGDGVVGFALNALREAHASANKDRLLLIEYDDLCKAPQEAIARVYKHINAPRFKHNFNHVEYSAGEFDAQIGAPGLHEVSGPVEVKKRDRVLPPSLFADFANDQFWRPGPWRDS